MTSSFENFDSSFGNDSAGIPASIVAPGAGATYAMAWNERDLYINNASTYATLTVKLPTKPHHGEFVRIGAKSAVTTLTIKDGFGASITGAPTTLAPNAAIAMRWVSTIATAVGWVFWGASGPNSSTGAAAITSGTIDGAVIGGVTPAAATFAGLSLDTADTISAAATQTQAAATQMTKSVNRIATVGTSGDGVGLPAATNGKMVLVINDGANPARVFAKASSSDTIDGVAAGTGVVLTNAKRALFVCDQAGAWYSLMGVKSA